MTKRNQLIHESLKLINSKGYKGTTMRDIASVMNCDVANLYNFIKNKNEILESTLFSINEKFHSEVDEIIRSNYDPIDQIKLVIQLYVRLSFEDPYKMSLLTDGYKHLESKQLARFQSEKKKFEEKIESIIKRGIRQNHFKKMNSSLGLKLVLSSVRWLFENALKVSDSIGKVEIERQISDFVLDGLRK